MSKKMLNDTIVGSDTFMDMPLSAQALYMHLNLNADNDGFVNPRRIVRMTGAANDDLQILIAKRYLLIFDSGIAVIKHWWVNNTRRTDRYAPTTYLDELAKLALKPNNAYTKNIEQLALETGAGKKPARNRQEFLPQHNINEYNINYKKGVDKKITKPKDQKTADISSPAYKKFLASRAKLKNNSGATK
jgi:hypothetical protein